MTGRTLSQDQIAVLLRTANWSDEIARTFWHISAVTGLSSGELTDLTWKDVDIPEGFVTVPDTVKGIRLIPLTPPAVKLLTSLAEAGEKPGSGKVFTDASRMMERLNAAALACGIAGGPEGMDGDILKRSFIRYLQEKGQSEAAIEEVYGGTP